MKRLLTYLLLFWNYSLIIAQPIDIYERPVQHEPNHAFDVLHYRIALDFEGENRAFQGQTVITFRSLSEDFNQIPLHAESYEVQSVKSKKGGVLSFSHKDGILDIDLSESLDYGDTLSVIVSYGTRNFHVDPTEFGMGSNYPLGIGYFEATDEQPFLFNAYSFPTGARHWFPCYDHPNDRASHETIITTQANHKVLANGILVSATGNSNGTITYHWQQNQAHPTYLYNFVSGPYSVVEDSHDDIPVNYWAYPGDEDKALRSFHRTPEVLAFFEDYYGVKYPWDKYDQIIVPGIGGGAEATTATLIGASTLHDERADQDFPSHWLVAHEAAHHWWGDLVSYKDWTETWLSESFATFSEYLYSNHLKGEEEGALNLYKKREAYLNEAKNRYVRPIVFNRWEYPSQNFDRHTYQKGALVLHMLRDYLGEENFKRTLNHFLTTHAFSPVNTHDFIKSVWEVTGQNMDWFFDQWIFGAGHPILDIQYEWKDKELILTVKQVQDTSGQVPIFSMPVSVAITDDRRTELKTVWVKKEESTFIFDVDQEPRMVRFDPENVLLKEWTFNKSKDELLYQAQYADVLGRMWAIDQLESLSKNKEVRTILTGILENDTFWAIRRVALITLTKNSITEQTSLLKYSLNDQHSRVRAAATRLLGETVQMELRHLFRNIYHRESSYIVQNEAIRALAKLKVAEDKSLFEEVTRTKSPRNILHQAGQWALEQLDQKP